MVEKEQSSSRKWKEKKIFLAINIKIEKANGKCLFVSCRLQSPCSFTRVWIILSFIQIWWIQEPNGSDHTYAFWQRPRTSYILLRRKPSLSYFPRQNHSPLMLLASFARLFWSRKMTQIVSRKHGTFFDIFPVHMFRFRAQKTPMPHTQDEQCL